MAQPLDNRRILLVEDERPIRMLVRVILESAGASVVDAEDGAQALRLLELDDGEFDAVVTDLSMPRLSGNELARQASIRWPRMGWVVCTALSEQIPTYLAGIADGIVSKPFVPSQLVRVVADACRTPTPQAAAS